MIANIDNEKMFSINVKLYKLKYESNSIISKHISGMLSQIKVLLRLKKKGKYDCVILFSSVTTIVTAGLSNNITLVGFQKNPYKYLNKAKILLMPSAWEGYGLAAVEALALGKPVVCSNVGGLPQIVNNSCGMICEQIEEYSNAVIKMIKDSNYYDLLSKMLMKEAYIIIILMNMQI